MDISPNEMTMHYRDNSESGHEITVAMVDVVEWLIKMELETPCKR